MTAPVTVWIAALGKSEPSYGGWAYVRRGVDGVLAGAAGGERRVNGALMGLDGLAEALTSLGDLAPSLPAYAIDALREAIPVFGKKIRGFDMADAVLTGVETRTSSPLRIPRGEDHQSTNTRGLYPAGEGASYAGGILSAGVDGIKVAESLARDITH